ncbi:MAG: hypothetical protein SGJ15_09510 [Bacteroidota bacterium]|nr:hypothetical protein [Bacteroidota bacterium]
MKLKRCRFTSIFFLVSFFISVSTNICLASTVSLPESVSTKTKDHLHVSEGVFNVNINDILFEENENEDEKEFEADLFVILIPFFLQTFSPTTSSCFFYQSSTSVIPTEQPIYIQVSNFRI